MPKILVVEDDGDVAQVVRTVLEAENHAVDVCHDGRDALEHLRMNAYDLLVLDLGLPGEDGIEICKSARRQKLPVSILMLTGRGRIQEKETGLDSGADDYLTKPFDQRELSARVRALLRRPPKTEAERLHIRDLLLKPAEHQVLRSGMEVDLLPQEFSLLHFLMRNPDQIFSVDSLIEKVWKFDSTATEEAVFSCVKRLRQKLGKDKEKQQSDIIETVRGSGYRFNSK